MNLLFERIRSASNHYLEELLPLYLESFPQEERRDSNALLIMLHEPDMYFSAVLLENQLVGMVVYWKFAGFLYLEHLAVFKDQRGKKIGEQVLKLLQAEGEPILLEVEMPFDEFSTRRIVFYNRSGFSALPIHYLQPPYRKGESVQPMMLFSDRTEWESEKLNKAIELFQYRVYGAKRKK